MPCAHRPEPAPKADKADATAKAETKAPDAPKSSPTAAAQPKNGEHKEGVKKG